MSKTLAKSAFLAMLAILALIPLPVRADLTPEPPTYATFENLQLLTLYIGTDMGMFSTSTVASGVPLELTFSLGYKPSLFSHPDYTNAEREEQFAALLEDYYTYIELWRGETFTPGATVEQTFPLAPTSTGSLRLGALTPGSYFIVAYQTNTLRNKASFCERNEISYESCIEEGRFTEYSLPEAQAYFRRPLDSEETFSDAFPTLYAGTRLTVLPTQGASSILFLPGIKGSRLFDGSSKKVWEPFGNHDIESLMLSALGKSLRSDIHTTPNGIIDTVAAFTDIYASFSTAMDTLVTHNTITEWRALPYDWRLSLQDIVQGGTSINGRLSYIGASDFPAIRASLEDLALGSKSGKVTIVAHSNGGLVAKELMRTLGDAESARLIDSVIFVGVPQSGAPQALAALLYGYREGLPWWFPGIVSTATARAFAENSPMGYHLLPSETYFAQTNDAVVSFGPGHAFQKERIAYGERIDTFEELVSFSLAHEGGRTKPSASNYGSANVLNADLLAYAGTVHSALDGWTPPKGIEVYQVAGWGVSTMTGIEYYEECVLSFCVPRYRPTFSTKGDGVVPVQSAHRMDTGQTYWIDLRAYGFGLEQNRNHGTLLGIEELHALIKSILQRTEREYAEKILRHEPSSSPPKKEWRFFLHSPLTLSLYDSEGKSVGPHSTTLQGATYGQLGDVQYILVPADKTYRVELDGYDTGMFSLDVQESIDGDVTKKVTFAHIPTTPDTIATLHIENSLETLSHLEVDHDGDGVVDESYSPNTQELLETTRKTSFSRSPKSEVQVLEKPLPLSTTTTVEVSQQKVVLQKMPIPNATRSSVSAGILLAEEDPVTSSESESSTAPSWVRSILDTLHRLLAYISSLTKYVWQ